MSRRIGRITRLPCLADHINWEAHKKLDASRWVEGAYIRPVGGCKHNDSGVSLEAIHLCEQLVDGLLALIIATPHAGTPLSSHSINLINEDNAWSLCLCLQTMAEVRTAHDTLCQMLQSLTRYFFSKKGR